ncbi:MAG: cytochrome o ubiquinol oxidase subunit III [Rhabdochlamydiaceae bacterium]|nr:cytochrome o ubiquinol oxidase subunit III [Rhabdochlamydiaceae bacterium]
MTHNHVQETDEKTFLGLWIYIMSDCLLFATLFVTYAVLHQGTAGGATSKELFRLPFVLIETMLLLTSSFTSGLAMLKQNLGRKHHLLGWLFVTFLLGASFVGMEIHEFRGLVQEGHSWKESAFLSGFFTLVGTHGLHVTVGLIWMAVFMIQVWKMGMTPMVMRRLSCLRLFWHFLDVVWIFIFTFVYLMGVLT